MRRRDWMIVAMAFAIPMWVACFLLPVSSIINCTPACGAVAGVTNCKNNGGSGECESTTPGCIHKQPAPSGHEIDLVTDDGDGAEQCRCPDTNELWLQWERIRVYKCTLHCKSHVFSDKKVHEPKYRYDEICPTQEEVSGEELIGG
jgi:hypothetical protein